MTPARTVLRRIFAAPHPMASTALALLVGAGQSAWAQSATADTAQLQHQLAQSMHLIEALTARVDQLERQLATVKAAPAPASAPSAAADANATRLDEVEKTVGQLTAASSRDLRDVGLPLHGFADVGVSAARDAPAGRRGGFAIGSLDFYLTPELGGNVKTLVELNFGVTERGETEADLERAQIGYVFSDQLTLWLGRFHTPFGYWNMAFHHGAQIQTSILRPRLLDFEDDGGILPVHTTGLWGTGSLRLRDGKLVYHLYAGNGTRIADGALDPNPAGDDNGNKVVGFGLGYRFGGTLDGLSLGLNGLTQTVGAYDAADTLQSRTRLRMLGSYAVYDNDGWEAIGELYRLHDADLGGSGGAHRSWAAYAQLGRAFGDRWMPYFRFEKAALDQGDNYFLAQANGRSYSRQVLGLRYNADPRAALKVEFNRTNDQGVGRALDELRLQYAVSF
ncbi:hypothetical protein [Piscinibacter sp.]|jgi:hypothetical protein|uniref:hypothetical protein n=1 Tax=Piscinibacter sp. TaxID=1903157 RepID=UPI003559E68C